MRYTALGNAGIQVSKLYVGYTSFDDPTSQVHTWILNPEENEGLVKWALDLGINFFNTVSTYSIGISEECLGRAIRSNTTHNKVVLITKVYFSEGHLSREAIIREIDGSLRRFGTDYVDLYVIHCFGYGVPIEETMEVLDSPAKTGRARALRVSVMYGYQFHNMQLTAEKNGWTPFPIIQNHRDLPCREDERELVPICRQQQVPPTLYSPLAAGRLARLEWKTDTFRSQIDKTAISKCDSTQESDYGIVPRAHEIAQEYGITMIQTALTWQFAKGMTTPIIGATRAKYFDDAVEALNTSLIKEDITYLEELHIPHRIAGALPPAVV